MVYTERKKIPKRSHIVLYYHHKGGDEDDGNAVHSTAHNPQFVFEFMGKLCIYLHSVYLYVCTYFFEDN